MNFPPPFRTCLRATFKVEDNANIDMDTLWDECEEAFSVRSDQMEDKVLKVYAMARSGDYSTVLPVA